MSQPEYQYCKCGASWLGHWYERCDWCHARKQKALEAYRQEILHPPWLQKQGPKYWELSEIDRQVWNRTRGIQVTENLVDEWGMAIAQAYADELVTLEEAGKALKKWTQLKDSLTYSESSSSNQPEQE